jgi:hypothetical protein
MKNGAVADRTAISDRQGKARISMKNAIVLDVRPFADFNPFIVPAQDRSKPDTRASFDSDLSNDDRRIRHVTRIGRRHVGLVAAQTECDHLPFHIKSPPPRDFAAATRQHTIGTQDCAKAKTLCF